MNFHNNMMKPNQWQTGEGGICPPNTAWVSGAGGVDAHTTLTSAMTYRLVFIQIVSLPVGLVKIHRYMQGECEDVLFTTYYY